MMLCQRHRLTNYDDIITFVIVDIKTILAQNVKNARKTLYLSQAKLAEYAAISLPYLTDIERRRTWVSDKTLQSLAQALHMEPWELLLPALSSPEGKARNRKQEKRKRMAEIITRKKEILRHTAGEVMEDLIMELLQEDPG